MDEHRVRQRLLMMMRCMLVGARRNCQSIPTTHLADDCDQLFQRKSLVER